MQSVLRIQYQFQLIHLAQVKYRRVLVELVRNTSTFVQLALLNADLRRPIYNQTAAYGHFGRTDMDLPWERTDKAATLKEQAGL